MLPPSVRPGVPASTGAGRKEGGLVRFNADGSIDKGFGSGGQELVPNSNPVLSSVIGVIALGLDANGDIVTLPSHLEFSPAGQPDATLTPAAITTASHSGAVTFPPTGSTAATAASARTWPSTSPGR